MPPTATSAPSSTNRRRRGSSARRDDESPIIPILARKVREIEAKAQRAKLGPTNRVKFQVIAFLVREERARVKADTVMPVGTRAELLKRLDGVATILAKTAARDTSLIQLLDVDQAASPVARRMRRDWLLESGAELPEDELIITDVAPVAAPVVPAGLSERQVTPIQVEARRESNPFLAPDLALRVPAQTPRRRLDGWELMGPLYKAFETGAGGGVASMELPEVPEYDRLSPRGLEIMPHQSRFLEAVRAGHRSFLLADEPGLGKTAESVLAAYRRRHLPATWPSCTNVVKMNWAREVERWTPHRRATVVNGDGESIDAFADVFIVNYEVLDRHLSWLANLGLKGMVVDEARFIKNLTSQRSKNVLALAARIREQVRDPLMLALTGTPLINDVEDFDAIWRFLGWTNGEKPGPELIESGRTRPTPADKSFYPEAREAVISMGIVRRKKKDVAADLPDKLVADLPVQLSANEFGRSIRQAEQELGQRLAAKYRRILEARGDRVFIGEFDEDIVRLVAHNELEESKAAGSVPRTSSRWFAASVRPKRSSRPITRCSCSARSARSCSSRSTST